MESLTPQELIYLANSARVMREKARKDMESQRWEANKDAFRLAVETYDELAAKCDRMAEALARAASSGDGAPPRSASARVPSESPGRGAPAPLSVVPRGLEPSPAAHGNTATRGRRSDR